MDDVDFERAAYYDPAYQTGWVHDPAGIARLLARRHGFIILDAGRLAVWMKAAAARDPSRTVCVLLQGLVPDTIAERKSANCTARRYLDAGGRLVCIGDVPFYQIGNARGGRKEWGDSGHAAVLGVKHSWGSAGESAVTEDGREWGLVLPDTGERCSPPEDVTPLRTVKGRHHGAEPLASTWHKAYNPRFPLQGFLRYRGGAFDHVHWNAKVNELARLALRGFEEALLSPASWRDGASEAVTRAVFSDPRYPALESADPQDCAARLSSAHGFAPLDADRLRTWMRAQVAAGAAGSVCVLLHGAAPDTVFDDVSPHCLARRFMDAGGRLVWAGDVPFYYCGRADGQSAFHGDVGTSEAVLDIPVRADWEAPAPPCVTEAGKAWGLKSVDGARRFADAACVTEVLAGCGSFASSWLKTYARDVPGSGFLCFRNGPFGPELADELAAVALHALPARAAAATPLVIEAEGERTGGGSFVVDRERALDKLMKFMLPSPELFLLPLARAAAASGARTFTLAQDGRDLVVMFDGEPLPPEAVTDPFAAVTTESPDPRLRAWGLAVLTALRARPREIGIYSGGSGTSAAVAVRSVREVAGCAVQDVLGKLRPEGRTVFRLVRPSVRLPKSSDLRESLAARAPGFAGPSAAPGRPPRAGGFALSFDDGTVRGCLRVPDRHRVASNLLVCVQGVGAATVSFVLYGAAQVEGWVNDDRLGLNASLNGIVRDERLEALAGTLREKLPSLLRNAVVRSHETAARRAERLLEPGMAALWLRHLHGIQGTRFAAAWGALARGVVPDALECELADEAIHLRWLRESAAGLLSSLDADKGDPARAALWRAPLFTSVDGSGLSLEALELARRQAGKVATSSSFRSTVGEDRAVVWAPPGPEVDALRRYFGDAVRPEAGPARRSRTGAGGLLEAAGVQDLLVRVPIEGGEAGLRLEPDRSGILIHGLDEGRSDSLHRRAHRYRIEAAVAGPAGAGSEALVFGAADRLYRAAASAFSCPVSFGLKGRVFQAFRGLRAAPLEREKAALSHLRDYLGASVGSESRHWSRSLPLYQSSAGWLSHDALASALERDGLLLWADENATANLRGLELDAVFGRSEGDARMPELFKGLERHALDRVYATVWLKAPPRLSCSHQAPFGCLAEGTAEGAAAHLAVSEKGEVLLYPLPTGPVRAVTAEAAGRLAYDAALAVALRSPQCLRPGEHPWRAFVLAVAARELGPWPGKPGTGALRAALFANLAFYARWGHATLSSLRDAMAGEHPLVYTTSAGRIDPAEYALSVLELALLRALWPERADRLLTADEFARYSKALTLESAGTPESHVRARAAARPAAVRAEKGRRAADLSTLVREVGESCGSWTAAADFTLVVRKRKELVEDVGGRRYEVSTGNPGAKAIRAAGLPPELEAAYLASLAHTAVNRLKAAVTDKDDVEFQAALAAWAADG